MTERDNALPGERSLVEGVLYCLTEKIGSLLRRQRLSAKNLGLILGFSDGKRIARQAAARIASHVGEEPMRSVLHRSAASLALNCEEYRLAEKLLAVGLAGDPPAEIADEMRDLMEQVYSHRELLVW